MPVGTGAERLRLIPTVPHVMDPAGFVRGTSKNISRPTTIAAPGNGAAWRATIPKAGIVSKLRITFEGEVTVTDNSGSVDTTERYPYGLLDELRVSLNGATDLFNVAGEDLHALRFARYAAYSEGVDEFPDNVGENTGIATGDLHVTWEVPLAIDDVTLAGALYAQSDSITIEAKGKQAAEAELFDVNGDAEVAITGNFYVEVVHWDVPVAEGQLVLPDIRTIHAVLAQTINWSDARQRFTLTRHQGVLQRLFISGTRATRTALSALPSAAAADKLAEVHLEYAGNRTPLDWPSAATLASLNNEHYGAPLPYDRLCIDTVREQPARDAILIDGVTELAIELAAGSGVTLASTAQARFVQEIAY